MEKMGSRIKEIRKDHKLTQDQFGEKIGLKDSAVSMLERNERSLTESVIKNILTEFCVNQTWLKYGIGEKYSQELLRKKSFLEYTPDLSSTSLVNKQLALFDKIQTLGAAEQKELLNVLDRLYSIFFISELKEDIYEYIKLLRLDLNKIIKLFVSDTELAEAVVDCEVTHEILADDEEELLSIYRNLDTKDRDEVLSFINFKKCTSDTSKKSQKSSACMHTEEAATVQSKIG